VSIVKMRVNETMCADESGHESLIPDRPSGILHSRLNFRPAVWSFLCNQVIVLNHQRHIKHNRLI